MEGSVSSGPSSPLTKRGSKGLTSASMNATTSPEAAASPAHSASPLPCIGGRPLVISSCDTTSAPALRATAAVPSTERESTTITSSTSGTGPAKALRIAVTMFPTVTSSSRAGMTTLTVVLPLARSSRRGGQSCVLLVRYVDQASTGGDIPVCRILVLPAESPPIRRLQAALLSPASRGKRLAGQDGARCDRKRGRMDICQIGLIGAG